jgi:hypothetical protein
LERRHPEEVVVAEAECNFPLEEAAVGAEAVCTK